MNGKVRKIAIIGHFGGNEEILDGQTIKTKILYDELSKNTEWKIEKVDTYYKNSKPLKLIWQTVKSVFTTKKIIILLSKNGVRFYLPFLYFFSKVFKTRVYHDVIGGRLDQYVKENPKFNKYLNSFVVNWVETDNLKSRLEKLGINNAEVIPNFKRLNCVKTDTLQTNYSAPYRFCIFSRIMKEKGIEAAISAIQEINKNAGENICELDIYGRIDDAYVERFDEVMKLSTSAITYRGTVPFAKSVEAIKDYYALLFPTFWESEGFPGTIVDAFSAGLPVIATDWNCNKEIIDDMVNGILYPNDKIKTLKEAIEWSISNSSDFIKMKKECVKAATEYQPDKYIEKIIEVISKN